MRGELAAAQPTSTEIRALLEAARARSSR